MSNESDGLKWKPVCTVDKYDDEGNHYESITCEGNLVVTAGLAQLAGAIIGGLGMSSTRCRLGVGDDATAAAAGDSDLSTSTNQYYRVMEATFPSTSGAVASFKGAFGPSDANFAWNCWGLDVGAATVTSSGTVNTLINRKVFSFGTKSGGTWTVTVTITLS